MIAAIAFLAASAPALAERPGDTPRAPLTPTPHPITIPRLDSPPTVEEFAEMRAGGGASSKMTRVVGFIQAQPRDGEPATQQTEGYLGYDDKHLYVVFVCFDSEPEKLRARLARRDNAWGDDWVELTLDTFHDERRGYVFWSNALGVQADGLWNEGGGGPSWSFDTVWHTKGLRTSQGFVVLMQIPFRSLRFKSADVQTWGITLQRVMPRANEWSYWPRNAANIRGRLNQDAQMHGLQNISPGRNMQFIPYGAFRSFRAVDERGASGPVFAREKAEFDGGLDAKFVVKDSLVLDFTVNPDFSQVESDAPQVVTNQRFEVFFPEKRPFFLENSNFFTGPHEFDLLFTRRIADPQFGARLTGKIGKYALGALIADDQSPGRSVAPGDPLEGSRALFAVARVSRDIFKQSSIGAMFATREHEGAYNRVASANSTLRMGQNWLAALQAVTSSTRFLDGTTQDGPLFTVSAHRSGRQFFTDLWYNDISPGFVTQTGFVPRTDIREAGHFTGYNFRPEGKFLISWGPDMRTNLIYDHQGRRLDWSNSASLEFELAGNTQFEVFGSTGRARLRPRDFASLPADRDYADGGLGLNFNTSRFKHFTVGGDVSIGKGINFSPAGGGPPRDARRTSAFFNVSLRPITPLVIENNYILFRLRETHLSDSIFNNHIVRQSWNWQFTRELSLRVILQYEAVLANQTHTTLETSKNFNADFLVTWMLHPGTALYLGYNSNLVNRDIFACTTAACATEFRRTTDFNNDAKGVFVKFSYLFRF